MSIKICSSDWMASGYGGFDFSQAWLPRIVAERMAVSSRDGVVDRAPDPVPFIDSDLVWRNTTGSPQHIAWTIHCASRTLVTTNPNPSFLYDATSVDVGVAPQAPLPVPVGDGIATQLRVTSAGQTQVQFGRVFADFDDQMRVIDLGNVADGHSVHVRYRCLFHTPGPWRVAPQPKYEAYARWARLRLWASPTLTAL